MLFGVPRDEDKDAISRPDRKVKRKHKHDNS